QTSHEYMQEWVRDSCPTYLHAHLEGAALAQPACTCGGSGPMFRCQECVGLPQYCRTCCRKRHRDTPLHQIEAWNGLHWQPSAQWQVGTLICLGHGGHACPQYLMSREELEEQVLRLTGMDGTDCTPLANDATCGAKPPPGTLGQDLIMTVVHTNGFHHLPVYQCLCPSAEGKDIQLLRMGLYPATSSEPQTAFTIQQLKHFHLNKVHAHISVETYCDLLRRTTNPTFPTEAPDRKRELTRAWQQWNHMTNLKHNGFGITSAPTKPGRGGTALYCPACPQPGINLPVDWETSGPGWKYWRYLTVDGNFVLNHIKFDGEEDIVWLTDGAGHVVSKEKLDNHLKKCSDTHEIPTCVRHRATLDKNKVKKGYDITGLVAVCCARHGCFAPGSAVDLQKGERQVNVDLAVSEAAETTNSSSTPGTRIAYDIGCQYCINFRQRMKDGPYSGITEKMEVQFLIGLFHVHGHKEECLARYASTFCPGTGVASGEILESLWSTLNGAADMTRNMTLAHRAETLDACMADSNWRKLQSMVGWLNRQHKLAVEGAAESAEAFNELNSTASPDQIKKWTSQMTEANAKRKKNIKAMDVYNPVTKKVQSRAAVQDKLMKSARKAKQVPEAIEWISLGIEIQEQQIELKAYIRGGLKGSKTTRGDPIKKHQVQIEIKRAALLRRIMDFSEMARRIWPDFDFEATKMLRSTERDMCVCEGDECQCGLASIEVPEEKKEVDEEDELISIPSSLEDIPAEWSLFTTAEGQLRVAQANEALLAICTGVARKSYEYRRNRKLATGKRDRTRTYDAINAIEATMRTDIKRYDQARWALSRLGLLTQYPHLKELTREDTKAVTAVYSPNARGQRDVALSWIWTVNMDHDTLAEEFVEELYRVSWIRACSRRDRWAEELIMVVSEMEWFVRYCLYHRAQASGWAESGLTAGHTSYAHRQSSMWHRLAVYAQLSFVKESGVHVPVIAQ
ncbi:hypothetical protein DFP72DRAFT_825364, partial [Ephemerocybe angulata]